MKTRAVKVVETPSEYISRTPEKDGWYILPKTGGMYVSPSNTAPKDVWSEVMPASEYQATDVTSARWIIRRYEEKKVENATPATTGDTAPAVETPASVPEYCIHGYAVCVTTTAGNVAHDRAAMRYADAWLTENNGTWSVHTSDTTRVVSELTAWEFKQAGMRVVETPASQDVSTVEHKPFNVWQEAYRGEYQTWRDNGSQGAPPATRRLTHTMAVRVRNYVDGTALDWVNADSSVITTPDGRVYLMSWGKPELMQDVSTPAYKTASDGRRIYTAGNYRTVRCPLCDVYFNSERCPTCGSMDALDMPAETALETAGYDPSELSPIERALVETYGATYNKTAVNVTPDSPTYLDYERPDASASDMCPVYSPQLQVSCGAPTYGKVNDNGAPRCSRHIWYNG